MTEESATPGIDMSGPITRDEWEGEDGLKARLLKQADSNETTAGMQDARHDGGAAELRAKVEIFDAALNGRIPGMWMSEVHTLRSHRDPDWVEHQRLRQKFKAP